jgi:hypothetical protein
VIEAIVFQVVLAAAFIYCAFGLLGTTDRAEDKPR